VTQKDLEAVSKEDLSSMDEEIKQKTKEFREMAEMVKDVQKHRDEAVNSLTNEQLIKKIETQKVEIQKKRLINLLFYRIQF